MPIGISPFLAAMDDKGGTTLDTFAEYAKSASKSPRRMALEHTRLGDGER